MRLITGFLITTVLILSACEKVERAPLDVNGLTPEQVMLKMHVLIVRGFYKEAETHFSKVYVQEFVTKRNLTFENYHKNPRGIDTRAWHEEALRTELIGNHYNNDVWRVGLSVDEGKGKSNPPGVVHDFYLINGAWKVVFWGDYPRS